MLPLFHFSPLIHSVTVVFSCNWHVLDVLPSYRFLLKFSEGAAARFPRQNCRIMKCTLRSSHWAYVLTSGPNSVGAVLTRNEGMGRV
jgi:hypothetical protein